jgi:TonB family protein
MTPNTIWLLPLAGLLIGFAASSLFLRGKPILAQGYSRSNYNLIEGSDMKLGLLSTIVGMMVIILSVGGYYFYQYLNSPDGNGPENPKPPVTRVFPPKMGPPPTIITTIPPQDNVKRIFGTALSLGIPTPVIDEMATDDALTQQELGNALAANATVNLDTIKGAVEFVKEDNIPQRSDFIELSRHPELIKQVKPVYPSICVNAGLEGRVFLNLLLDFDGHVKKVEISKTSGNNALDEAAMEAAAQFIFSPALSPNGKPVRVWVSYPVTFSLPK